MKTCLLILSFVFVSALNATVIPDNPQLKLKNIINTSIEQSFFVSGLVSLKPKDIEKLLGRSLRFKEKIGFFLLKQKLKRHTKTKGKTKDHGKNALTFGILALLISFLPIINILSIPLAILAIIQGKKGKRLNPADNKAKVGFWLGIVSLAITVLILCIMIDIFVNGFSWGTIYFF